MTMIQELERIEQQDSQALLTLITQESTELVHTVGLLAEEMQQLLQDTAQYDPQSAAEINQFILEEVLRVRRVLAAAVLNQAVQSGEKYVFVLENEDNVGVLVGGDANAGEVIEIAGRAGGQDGSLSLSQDAPAGALITLRDLSAGETLMKYSLPLGKLDTVMPSGTPIDKALLQTP